MSKIDELLKNEKVEWKKLGKVAVISKGRQFNRRDMLENGIYPVINGGILPSGYIDVFNSEENTITVSQGGASAGFVNFTEEKFWLGAHAFSVVPNNDIIKTYNYGYRCFNRFLFHILKMNQAKLQESKVGAGIPSVSKDELSNIEIPLTSKETQEKIVVKLDKFINYVTELQAELQARNKQYEYYRNILLSEENLNKLSEKINGLGKYNKVFLAKISDLCLRQKGISITAEKMKEINKENAPVKIFAGGNTTANVNVQDIGKKNIINIPSVIVKSRGNIDFEYYDKPFSHKNEMWSYSTLNNKVLNIKFLYYLLKNNLKYFRDNSVSGKLPQITTRVVDNYEIPIPHIFIQDKIVQILDKFQALLLDTKGFLPQEIKQRQKQYGFYCKKLLTFNMESGTISRQTDRQTDRQIISNSYFVLLKEAAKIVGIKLYEVEWKKIKKVFELRNGYTPSKRNKEFWENGTIPWFRMDDLRERGKIVSDSKQHITEKAVKGRGLFKSGSIILATTATIGVHAMLIADSLANQQFTNFDICKSLKDRLLPKYVFYYFNIIDEWCRQHTKVSSFPAVNMDALIELDFPIPSLETQSYLVSILDEFDALVNDISQGLPKEIELRKKQYEYYRGKLLDFKK